MGLEGGDAKTLVDLPAPIKEKRRRAKSTSYTVSDINKVTYKLSKELYSAEGVELKIYNEESKVWEPGPNLVKIDEDNEFYYYKVE